MLSEFLRQLLGPQKARFNHISNIRTPPVPLEMFNGNPQPNTNCERRGNEGECRLNEEC